MSGEVGEQMAIVHVFGSAGRFHSVEEMRRFIDQTYTDDGDGIPSPFMREVGLSEYEPMCIEAVHAERCMPLQELLPGVSWADQWLTRLGASMVADAAICVFAPNAVEHPLGSSLEYCGAYEYEPRVTAERGASADCQ